jgi:P27 family predicted phage terminase small subunit
MRGRKATPTALKVLRGNPGRRPINLEEPQPDALDDACPVEISDEAARREWERAIVPAIRIGQITAADRTLAVAHCELWATWQSQLAEAIKHPHVISAGKHRYPLPNPARVMANRTLLILTQVDEKLGFSPTSRGKVQVKGPGSIQSTLDKRRAKFFALGRG